MKRPSFQFYTGDWTSNPNLRRCSHAEKGIWIDVMCILHDQDEYGVLRWPLKEIAQAVGCTVAALRGLVAKSVLKGSDARLDEPFVYVPRSGRKEGAPVVLLAAQDGPIWYSSRMVKDEHVRTIRGESSRFGAGNDEAPKAAPKVAPKPPFGDGSSSSSSSSPSDKTEKKREASADRSPSGSRIPDGFPGDAELEHCRRTRPDLPAETVAQVFRDHWLAKPGKDGRKLDWPATWRVWVARERGYAPARASPVAATRQDRISATVAELTGRSRQQPEIIDVDVTERTA